MIIRIGTRGSALARTQTADMRARIVALGHDCPTIVIRTTGDKDQVRPFGEIGAPGLFVREIHTALLEKQIDLAVHSFKDLPTGGPEELTVAAIPERVDPADRLLIREEAVDENAAEFPLREGSVVGTASGRRQVLLRDLRPDLSIESLRGNVPTRLRRLRDGDFDAVLLAAAGLGRLEKDTRFLKEGPLDFSGLRQVRLDPAVFVPAPAQGALALEARREDGELLEALAPLHDSSVARPLAAERRLQELVEGGCQLPFGAWCRELEEGGLELFSVMESGGRLLRRRAKGDDPASLAEEVWNGLRQEA